MIKDSFNSKIRAYVKENLSPTNCYDKKCYQCDTCFVSMIYNSFKTVLDKSCIQIGSYPRFTAIRPLHDLDILYILGNWDNRQSNPFQSLKNLLEKLKREYKNPTTYEIKISLQTHSVTITFKDNDKEVFSVDIVPAYIVDKNEFEKDIYRVPEILNRKHGKQRSIFYEQLAQHKKQMNWINTDPRGYIEIAKQVNQSK